MDKLHRVLCYGSVTKEEYNELLPKVENLNRRYLITTSSLGVVFTTLMFILSFMVNEFKGVNRIYLFGMSVSAFILIGAVVVSPKWKFMTHLLVWFAIECFMLYGIGVSAIKHNEYPGVTFMVLIVFMAIIYIDRPVHTICLIGIDIVAYDVLVFYSKSHEYFVLDLVNSIIFGCLAFAWCCISTARCMKGLLKDKKLIELANVDQLTQLNNRNCYELKLEQYERMHNNGIACIYMDINGLHELNNSKGHEAGDEMLKFIAEQVKRYFGTDNSYRIGGDEYVAFLLNKSKPEVQDKLIDFKNSIENANYSISFGVAYKVGKCNIQNLIKKAETRMFEDKNKYYETHKR